VVPSPFATGIVISVTTAETAWVARNGCPGGKPRATFVYSSGRCREDGSAPSSCIGLKDRKKPKRITSGSLHFQVFNTQLLRSCSIHGTYGSACWSGNCDVDYLAQFSAPVFS
jgi:hypothetical protein